jgi:mannose/fructose-specific phosphotransferase system component IIA
MKAVLILSHSTLAKGLYEATKLFIGDNVNQFDYLGLQPQDDPSEFGLLIEEKIKTLDSGDGVIILVDLMGGSPGNQAMKFVNDKIDIITGVNLPMVLDLILKRNNEMTINIAEIVETSKSGIEDLKSRLAEMSDDDEEE